ncbi:MAG: M1 family metallopeptidase [Bacteroidia bacterium]|nr:M1 family metallopeptidase [Bacteroidia bacterium]
MHRLNLALKLVWGATLGVSCTGLWAQPAQRWQQRADYQLEVALDVKTHRYTGKQAIRYVNNSPDTLRRLFFHLYPNAFQPGSVLDWRLRTEDNPTGEGNRIKNLKPEEQGRLVCSDLTVNGLPVRTQHEGTILEVWLEQPILPNSSANLALTFEGQVPLTLRRMGRDNAEGIAYSMAQWYPKLCQYDYQGWHATPYAGRAEFYPIWGDWDVKLTLDSRYIVAATGYLQNAQEIGYGYQAPGTTVRRPKTATLTWHFKAPMVNDFTFAADPDYQHTTLAVNDTLTLHFFYQNDANKTGAWTQLPAYAKRMFEVIQQRIGNYPYRQYSFIQGGDGGMEYSMCTLITGQREALDLADVAQHELLHTWFQMLLANNEGLHGWMDEGFNMFVGTQVQDYTLEGGAFEGNSIEQFQLYYRVAHQNGWREPLSTHSDHYHNYYGQQIGIYHTGGLYLNQLKYIVGEEVFWRALKRYYYTWRFKHPNPNDFLRIVEQESGLVLDWYNEYFVYTTKTVDYAVSPPSDGAGGAEVILKREGKMPLPVEVQVTYTDGATERYYIPLDLMRGAKPYDSATTTLLPDWAWVVPTYTLKLTRPRAQVATVALDPEAQTTDLNPENNRWSR